MKIKFLLAEEIRPEISGKSTVLGLFPDDVLIMQSNRPEGASPDIPDGLDRLTFFLNVSDIPEGKHYFKGNITDPTGAPYNQLSTLGEEIIKAGLSRTIIVEMKPFIVKTKGIYHFNLYVDDVLTTFPFEIR
jgi:hypothetical protein